MQSCYVVAWHPIRVVHIVGPRIKRKGEGRGLIFQTYCWILEYVALLFWAVNWAGVK